MYFPGFLNSKRMISFRYSKVMLCSMLVWIGWAGQSSLAFAGQTGGAFLKMPVSANSAGSMSVFAAQSQTPLALFDHPVGISGGRAQIAFSHNFWVADVSGDAIALTIPLQKSTLLATGLHFVKVPGIEVRDLPSDEPFGEIQAQYLTWALGLARDLTSHLTIGVSLNYLYEYLYTETAHGLSLDFGANWRRPGGGLNVSFLAQNMGFMTPLNETSERLPLTLKLGCTATKLLENELLVGAVGLNLGLNTVTGDPLLQLGMEWILQQNYFIRAGFERIAQVNRAAFGLGFGFGKFRVDYAFILMPAGLGSPHLLTLAYNLQ